MVFSGLQHSGKVVYTTVARRCISANAIHFPSSIELDIRYFAIRYTVFNAAVTAASLRSPKPRFRSVQRYCARRNLSFAMCNGTALTETQVSLCAAVLRSPKPKFRSVKLYCAHRNPGFALCSCTALTETQVLLCAAVLHSPKQRFRSVQSHCTHSMLLMYSLNMFIPLISCYNS